MSNIYLRVTIEKKWRTQNFDFLTLKSCLQVRFWGAPTYADIRPTTGRRPTTLLKKSLWHRCFPVNFVKYLRTPFVTEHLWWLLLKIVESPHWILKCVCAASESYNTGFFYKKPVKGNSTESFLILLWFILKVCYLVS